MERKTGTIKMFQPAVPATYVGHGGKTMNSWLVTMEDGNQYKFSSIGDFKYQPGTRIGFDVDMNNNYALKVAKNVDNLDKPKPPVASFSSMGGGKGSKDDFILLQVCFKEVMQAFGKDYEHLVLQKTEEYYDGLKSIYNRKQGQ